MNRLIIVFIIFNLGCNSKYKESKTTISQHLSINVPINEVVNDNLIESADYIFLDSDFLIGRISRVLFFDNKIFVHDEMTSRIIVFSMKGKYLFHIDKKGKGVMEYLKISDFTIDKNNEELIIYDELSHKILNYSISEREFVKEHKVGFYPIALAWSNDCLYFFNPYTFNYPREDRYHYSLIKTTHDFKNEERFFRIDKKMGNFMSNPNRKGFFYGENICFLNRFDNIIYSLAKDSIHAHCNLLFADNEDYPLALEDAIGKGTRNTERYNDCAADIRNFCETNDIITFNYSRYDKLYSVIYSKVKNDIILHQSSFKATSPLMMKQNIPIYYFPSFVMDNSFVSILPFRILNHYLQDDNFLKLMETDMTNKQLMDKIKKLDENSNPVLALYKFKS